MRLKSLLQYKAVQGCITRIKGTKQVCVQGSRISIRQNKTVEQVKCTKQVCIQGLCINIRQFKAAQQA